MPQTRARSLIHFIALASVLGACAGSEIEPIPIDPPDPRFEKALTDGERHARLLRVLEAASRVGLRRGALLAGIASAETGLVHCWREATWACQGPWSESCGGPVVAGAGDGPCWWREGGLGMFQLDGGNHDETLTREGDAVLTLEGNVGRAVEFMVSMLVRSAYVSVNTRAEAMDWVASVHPGGAGYDAWIRTVTHYYNGCAPGVCRVFAERYDRYDRHARRVWGEIAGGGEVGLEAPEEAPVTDADAPTTGSACGLPHPVAAGGTCRGAEEALGCPGEVVNCTTGRPECRDLWIDDVLTCGLECCP